MTRIIQNWMIICERGTQNGMEVMWFHTLMGIKAWVRSSHACTEIACTRCMQFSGFCNNHMTSNTSFGRDLAYFCLVTPLQRMAKLY